MQEEGKPKSQTEKCEVFGFWTAKPSGGPSNGLFFHGNFYKQVGKKW
jgi:hypothetical protein